MQEQTEDKKVENKKAEEKKKETIIDDIKVILYALLLSICIKSFFYEPFIIPSGSMKPLLIEGDIIFVSKFEYGYSRYSLPFGMNLIPNRIFDYRKPKRGDVIVFKLPTDPKIFYIKRLIGMPGDTVQMKDGDLYINNKLIKKEYNTEYYDEKYDIKLKKYTEYLSDDKKYEILHDHILVNEANNTKEYKVPEGYYFFMGDNRDNSLDSRFTETGFVPYKNIVGKAKVIFISKKGSIILNLLRFKNPIRFNRTFKKIK